MTLRRKRLSHHLILVITQLLNSPKGQAAHIANRVFYQGESAVTAAKLQRASIVLDSNNGGRHPFKIVTAFPSKDDPFLGCWRARARSASCLR